jgi:hypothetical protein
VADGGGQGLRVWRLRSWQRPGGEVLQQGVPDSTLASTQAGVPQAAAAAAAAAVDHTILPLAMASGLQQKCCAQHDVCNQHIAIPYAPGM